MLCGNLEFHTTPVGLPQPKDQGAPASLLMVSILIPNFSPATGKLETNTWTGYSMPVWGSIIKIS